MLSKLKQAFNGSNDVESKKKSDVHTRTNISCSDLDIFSVNGEKAEEIDERNDIIQKVSASPEASKKITLEFEDDECWRVFLEADDYQPSPAEKSLPLDPSECLMDDDLMTEKALYEEEEQIVAESVCETELTGIYCNKDRCDTRFKVPPSKVVIPVPSNHEKEAILTLKNCIAPSLPADASIHSDKLPVSESAVVGSAAATDIDSLNQQTQVDQKSHKKFTSEIISCPNGSVDVNTTHENLHETKKDSTCRHYPDCPFSNESLKLSQEKMLTTFKQNISPPLVEEINLLSNLNSPFMLDTNTAAGKNNLAFEYGMDMEHFQTCSSVQFTIAGQNRRLREPLGPLLKNNELTVDINSKICEHILQIVQENHECLVSQIRDCFQADL